MIAVVSDTLIAAAIVTPIVLFLVVLFLRNGFETEKREADALAPRLKCPDCGTNSLVWAERVWAMHTSYDNGDSDWSSSLTFRCGQCGKEFEFTRDGVRFDIDRTDHPPEK
jgi:DNA-directed RNA polymerase subunit RPC12/RpoP